MSRVTSNSKSSCLVRVVWQSLMSAGVGLSLGSSGHSVGGGPHQGQGAHHHHGGHHQGGGLRRASEDHRYRAFLSSHFDAQGFVTNIIKEGNSEEYFTQIGACIKEVSLLSTSLLTSSQHLLRWMKKLRLISQATNMISCLGCKMLPHWRQDIKNLKLLLTN